MKVMRSAAEKLFVGLGTAADVVKDWSVKRLTAKVTNLPKSHADAKIEEDAESNSLLKKIKKALGNGKDVTVIKDGEAESNGEAPAADEAEVPDAKRNPKKDKKTKKKDKAAKPDKADNTDKKKKKKVVTKKSKEGGPGKIETIIKLLKAASKKNPITKDEILDELVKVFGEEDREKMKKTISLQVPTFLRSMKELDVQKNEEGYWIK